MSFQEESVSMERDTDRPAVPAEYRAPYAPAWCVDLHMHTTVSDGTDTPEQLLANVKKAGIRLFSVTDHDAIYGAEVLARVLEPEDPLLLSGVEFSCKDTLGKYHILGYGYDPEAAAIRKMVEVSHGYRIEKVLGRLARLREEFGIEFPDEDLRTLMAMHNPGKPHIGNLMVRHGYAPDRGTAIKEYINKVHFRGRYVAPEEAIQAILKSGGIPILAHPSYGSGDELIVGDEMEERLRRLLEFGIQGVEAFYSGFSDKLIAEQLTLADRYHLYVTAGSDYHGSNKMIELGENNLPQQEPLPEGLTRFLEAAEPRMIRGRGREEER